ncbi:uncharacterized protein LOC110849213 [Folsomia candida]|uniref:Uncharacterized protein n=1 Tax=Folsomia candida TaxID=158441 RepID=A0A226EE99_FOLCA|nr:uncharacterized protein LOC110849213 [Folsomia candida]OXA55377.1 hypothetical protein Fcan01_09291 [Folsomia candida]
MSKLFSSLLLRVFLVTSLSYAYLNIEQYCRAFDDSFRPMICILKNSNNSTNTVDTYPQDTVAPDYAILIPEKIKAKFRPKLRPRPKPRPRPRPRPNFHRPPPIYIPSKPDYGDGWDSDSDEDCSCDTNCYPVIANQNPNVTGVSYRCRSCGSMCWVRSLASTNCSCAVPSGNATCTCVANCASFRDGLGFADLRNTASEEIDDVGVADDIKFPNFRKPRMSWGWTPTYDYDESNSDSGEDINCIFTISNLTDTRIGLEQRPFNCACCKSTEAQRTSDPDFVCICQRVSVTERQKSGTISKV